MQKLMAALAVAALTVTAPAVAQAAFPGQNGKLAFYAPVPDGPQSVHDQVFTINSDGTGVRQLTTDTGADSARGVWSPDGNTIAFDRFGDLQSQAELATMTNEGTQVRALGHAGFAGGWAPDGRTIAFWYFGFSYDIYTIRSDGNGLTRVTNSSSQEGQPDWSPDGTEIAFASNFNTINSQNDIYTVKADLTEDAVQIVTAFGTD